MGRYTSSVFREIQCSTVNYYCTRTRMVKSERPPESNVSEDVEQLELVDGQFGKQAVYSKLTYIFHMT